MKPVEIPYELAMNELLAQQHGPVWTDEIDKLLVDGRALIPPAPYPSISVMLKKYYGVSIAPTTLRDRHRRLTE